MPLSVADSGARITIVFFNIEYIATEKITVPQLKVTGLVSILNLFLERSVGLIKLPMQVMSLQISNVCKKQPDL